MRVLKLKNPFPYGFEDENDPLAILYLDELKTVHHALLEGNLHCRFIDGDRKGSIAKLKVVPGRERVEPSIRFSRSFYNNSIYRFENEIFCALCHWTGRSNKPSICFPNREVELLIGYDGPTIWEKFDAASAKEKILKSTKEVDIDGNVLGIGDRVIYINARYGSGMSLERGTINEFKVSVNSKRHSVSTIIQSDNGERSEISYPGKMVSKIS